MMNSPYSVLGIKPSADEAEIKAAYKRMTAKYYAASGINSAARIEELNHAFDEIVKQRCSQSNKPAPAAVSEYADVRRLISCNRLNDADEILDSVKSTSRGGEWNYLKALILYKRGFLKEADVYAQRAVAKDCTNEEFAALLKSVAGTGSHQEHISLAASIMRLFRGNR